jgi:hypothetical protein
VDVVGGIFSRHVLQVFATYTPYYPFRGVEFLCLCISTLMVLHRLLRHTLDSRAQTDVCKLDASKELEGSNHHTGAGAASRRHRLFHIFFNAFSLIVLSFCISGIICGLADAVFYDAQRRYSNLVSAASSAGDKEDTAKFKTQASTAGDFQANARSAQHFCEVIPLHLLIVMFVIVGRSRYGPCTS